MAKEVRFDDNEIYNLISSFQMEIIEKKGFEKQLKTYFQNYDDSIIVYENFHENETLIGAGDPLCLWVNKSVIDTIENIKWIQIKRLDKKNKWIYFKFDVINKKGDISNIKYSFEYKIKANKIGRMSNGKTNFKKIKIQEY